MVSGLVQPGAGRSSPLSSPSPGVILEAGVRLPAGAEIIPPVFMGKGCRVGAGVKIGPRVVLENDVRVAPGSRLKDVVAWPGARLEGEIEGCITHPGATISIIEKTTVDY